MNSSYEILGQAEEWETIPSFELEDHRRDQLHSFRASLDRAIDSGYHSIDNHLFDTVAHENTESPNRPTNQSIAQKIKDETVRSGLGFYTSEDYEWLQTAGLERFDVIRSAKAETSAHGVFFGVLSNPETGDTFPVAVKTCQQNPRKAYLDWLNNNLIAKTDRKHFEPVGFVWDSGVGYSLSRIERGVETYDNTDWRYVLFDPENPQYEGKKEQLNNIGKELAGIHEERIFHGDPQFKNIAIDPAGRTFLIDWESAQHFGSEAKREILITKAAHDLEVLFYSAAAPEHKKGVGLLSGYERTLQWEYFNKFILTPYIEARVEADDSLDNIELVDAIEAQVKEYVLKEFVIGATKKFIKAGQDT